MNTGRPEVAGHPGNQEGPDVRRQGIEKWLLSKFFARSNDPLLIVRGPYTQEQTLSYMLFVPSHDPCTRSLRHNREIYLKNMISP